MSSGNDEQRGWGTWEDAERWRRESFARCGPRARLAWLDDVWRLSRAARDPVAQAPVDAVEEPRAELKPLAIDMTDLVFAFESGGETTWYLDRESGEIQMICDSDPELTRELAADIDAHPDRYLAIESVDSYEGFRIMRDFIRTVEDAREAARLERALSGRKPFRAFKDALDGEVRKQWFAFHDAAMRELAIAWLESEGIAPVAKSIGPA